MNRRELFQTGAFAALGAGAGVAGDRLLSNRSSPSGPPLAAGSVVRPESFGAIGDGSTDDRTAFMRAATAAGQAGGGTVELAGGRTYAFGETLDLSDFSSVVIESPGGGTLLFTGTHGPALRLASASRLTFSNLSILYANGGFTGHLVDTDHSAAGNDPAHNVFERCFLGGRDASAHGAASLVRLNRAVETRFVGCQFRYSKIAVLGRDPDYSNVITFEGCAFRDQSVIPLKNAGEDWVVRGCTFEPLYHPAGASGHAGAYLDDDGNQTRTLAFLNCWMGDVPPGGTGTWITFNSGRVLQVVGGVIFSAGERPGGVSVSVGGHGPDAVNALAVVGAWLAGPVGLSFPAADGCRAAFVAGCDLPAVAVDRPENCRSLVAVANNGLDDRSSRGYTVGGQGGITVDPAGDVLGLGRLAAIPASSVGAYIGLLGPGSVGGVPPQSLGLVAPADAAGRAVSILTGSPIPGERLRVTDALVTSREGVRIAGADGLTTKVTASPPADADFAAPPPDGTMVVDAAQGRLYVRVGGRWRFARLT